MIKIKDSLAQLNIKKERSDRFFILYVLVLVLFILSYCVMNTYVFFNVKVSGSSMRPTLYGAGDKGDVLIANRLKTAERGDIVIIAGVEEYWLIKRVIALEGDTVKIANGRVYVNGNAIAEPYTSGDPTQIDSSNKYMEKFAKGYTLEENEVFYLGDNRALYGSSDSRDKDVCKEDNIIGVVSDWSVKNKELLRRFYAIPTAIKDFFKAGK
jgi:signal peptidase I